MCIDIQTFSDMVFFITIDEHLQLNRGCYFPHSGSVLREGILFSQLFPLLNVIQSYC